MPTFTVFCQESGGSGTIHISAIEADTVAEAITLGLEETAHDWDQYLDSEDPHHPGEVPDISYIHCLGVIVGDPEFAYWEDICERDDSGHEAVLAEIEKNREHYAAFEHPVCEQAALDEIATIMSERFPNQRELDRIRELVAGTGRALVAKLPEAGQTHQPQISDLVQDDA